MSSVQSFTASQLAFLESVLCTSPIPLAMEEVPGGCEDGEASSKPSMPTPDLDGKFGTQQADVLSGTEGTDYFQGGNGNDQLFGDAGRDWLEANNGDDILDGGEGRDDLKGGNGDDELRGGKGKDDVFGENGNDLLIGGCGPDLLDGGRGDDVLFGGNSPDVYTGGLGRDVFVLALPGGEGGHGGSGEMAPLISPLAGDEEGDVITDFRQGDDRIALAGGLTFGQLICSADAIYVRMEEETLTPLALTPGAENEAPGRLLATLNGFDTTKLTEADFITCADISVG